MKKYSKFLLTLFSIGVKTQAGYAVPAGSTTEPVFARQGSGVSVCSSMASQASMVTPMEDLDAAIYKGVIADYKVVDYKGWLDRGQSFTVYALMQKLFEGDLFFLSESELKEVQEKCTKALEKSIKEIKHERDKASGNQKLSVHQRNKNDVIDSEEAAQAAFKKLSAEFSNPTTGSIGYLKTKYSASSAVPYFSIEETKDKNIVLKFDVNQVSKNKVSDLLSATAIYSIVDEVQFVPLLSEDATQVDYVVVSFNVTKHKAKNDKNIPLRVRCKFDLKKYNQLVSPEDAIHVKSNGSKASNKFANKMRLLLSSKEGLSQLFKSIVKVEFETLLGTYYSKHESDDHTLCFLKMQKAERGDRKILKSLAFANLYGFEVAPLSDSSFVSGREVCLGHSKPKSKLVGRNLSELAEFLADYFKLKSARFRTKTMESEFQLKKKAFNTDQMSKEAFGEYEKWFKKEHDSQAKITNELELKYKNAKKKDEYKRSVLHMLKHNIWIDPVSYSEMERELNKQELTKKDASAVVKGKAQPSIVARDTQKKEKTKACC